MVAENRASFINECQISTLGVSLSVHTSAKRYKCLQGVAPSYRTDDLCRTAVIEARHCLRLASSPSLIVRHTRLSTYGDRAFLVAAS